MNKIAKIYAPAGRKIKETTSSARATTRERIITPEFFVCFISFTMVLYSNVAGTWAIVGFLAPWIYVILRQFFTIPRLLRQCWPLLILPGWAILSILWSIEPAWTLRASLEFSASMMVGILAGFLIKPRVFIAATMSALMVIALLCMLKPETYGAIAAHTPIQGIFGSKNAFSAIIGELMLASIAVLYDKKQAWMFRLMSLGGIAISPPLLILARSVDSILAVGFTIIVFLSVRFFARFDHKIRLVVSTFIMLFALAFILILSFAQFDPVFILNMLGKDATLTGRTYLWSRAADFIADRPFLGFGWNAFWRLGNAYARELWYASKVPMGAGFGFHNEYIDAWIGLGVVGLIIELAYLFIVAKRVIKGILGTMTTEQYFALLFFIIFVIRSPVEGGVFGAFNINLILFCAIWKYFGPPKPAPVQPLGLPGNRKNKASPQTQET